MYIFNFTRFYFIFEFQELYQLAQTVIGAHLMPTAMMANIEAKLLLHNLVLMPMPPRLITLLYKNAKGQLNSLEKYGKKIFNYWYGFVEWYLQRKRSYLGKFRIFWEYHKILRNLHLPYKRKVEISQNFVAFSEYMNFNWKWFNFMKYGYRCIIKTLIWKKQQHMYFR